MTQDRVNRLKLTEVDREEWLNHPVTQALSASLASSKLEIQQDWVEARFTGSTADETLQMNSKAIGYTQCVDDITNWMKNGEQ